VAETSVEHEDDRRLHLRACTDATNGLIRLYDSRLCEGLEKVLVVAGDQWTGLFTDVYSFDGKKPLVLVELAGDGAMLAQRGLVW